MKHLIAIIAATALLCGCGTFTVKPGADPVVVYAEATAETFVEVADSYLAFERRNEAALAKLSPEFHKVANEIRDNGKLWHDELRKATKVYKANKTAGNKTTLETAQAFLEMAVQQMRELAAKGQVNL